MEALGIEARDVVAVAGAGGKTTLVYRLAEEARRCGLRVLVTTTTHMGTLP
ncbi:MAG TPA: putative selenium-dependent hydroxylase accessory protein YqeC, partial [Vicinamibacteria bacterium]